MTNPTAAPFESNPITDGYHDAVDYANQLTLAEVAAAGGKITRLRILTEYVPQLGGRVCDVSYVHATLPDGTIVPVNVNTMPTSNLIPARKLKATLIEWAKAERVYAKGLGLLDDSTLSELR